MIYKCVVCSRTLQTKASDDASLEPWSIANGLRPVVGYAYKLEDSYCCNDCLNQHDGLGKFENYMTERGSTSSVFRKAYGSERKPLAVALILYAWSLDSSEDDYMISEGWGYCGRFGNFLLCIDDRGAVTYEEFSDEAAAEKEFQQLYSEGWGASEDDAYIYFSGHLRNGWHGYSAQMEGKELNVYPPRHSDYISERRAIAAVRLESIRTGYYPNLWKQGERGDLTLLHY